MFDDNFVNEFLDGFDAGLTKSLIELTAVFIAFKIWNFRRKRKKNK